MADANFTWMHSKQLGAPQMTGAAGSNGQMLQMLDACLLDGFNTQTVSTVTAAATTVTLSFGTFHGFVERQLVVIAGATDAALNGTHRVITVSGNDIILNISGVTQTTGTITVKVAPLGFESIFGSTDTLKRAYRSKNLNGTRTVLYLDMALPTGHGYDATSPVKRAMVSLCEDMTSLGVQINSYTDTKNDYATNPNGSLFWYQARDYGKATAVTNAANGQWVIVGNGDYFYFFQEWTSNGSNRNKGLRDLYGFGDIPSFAGVSDRHNCMWLGSISTNDNSSIYYSTNGARIGGYPSNASQQHGFFISNYSGVGGLRYFSVTPDGRASVTPSESGYETGGIDFPNPASQSIIGLPLYAMTLGCLRASMPRLLAIPQNINLTANSEYDLARYDNLLVVSTHYGDGGGTYFGYFCLDMGD